MTPEYTNQLAAELLLTSFMGVVAIGILVTWLVIALMRRRQPFDETLRPRPSSRERLARFAYQPPVFDRACRWLVVKSNNLAAVQSALGLHNPVPCSWGEGLAHLSDRKLFVAPPVRGWVLVVGPGLPDPSEDIDRCFHFMRRLSRAFRQVQFYSVDRALNYHAWVRVERGQIRRAYTWAGETLWNQGEPTPDERALRLQPLDYGESAQGKTLDGDDPCHYNAEHVTTLAARWSFDPTALPDGAVDEAVGVAGELILSQRL